MSAAPQRGRRRAEPASRPSFRDLATAHKGNTRTHAASPRSVSAVTTTAKCMAAVAVVGALMAAGSVASNTLNPVADASDTSNLVAAIDQGAPAAISAPSDAAISFSGINISSKASPTATASTSPVKPEADAVTPVASPNAAPLVHPVAVDDPAAAKAFAASQLGAHGWGADQMNCLNLLWERESNWRTTAENASSGAYGIVQSLPASKMESVGSDWATNYETQIRWGLGYIEGRYGSPCGAWGHSESVGWY